MSDDLQIDVEAGVATLRFNRPDVLNALTFDIYLRLREFFENLRTRDDVRVVLLTGSGKGFCSGGDVHEIIGKLLQRDTKQHLEFTRMTGAVVRNMQLLDKPIISAINGTAAGAGAVLALASDLRLAAESASFAFLFTKVGLTGADMGAAYLLPKLIGVGRAMELLLLGDRVDAKTAHSWGLVNRVVPNDQLMKTAMEWALRLANGPSLAIGMTKTLVVNESNMDLISAIESEAQAQALLLMGEDHRRFYEAFSEGRKPKFEGN